MKILITGSSGPVGRKLKNTLANKGYEVFCLLRSIPENDKRQIYWDP